jgi:hypothetical protein
MPRALRIRIAAAVVATIASTAAAATPAFAASRDVTPPTAPVIIYAQGYNCLQVIVAVTRSSDNVTPQAQLRYTVFANGKAIGTVPDRGDDAGVWAWLQNVLTPGSDTITVEAEDAAGNFSSPSSAVVVTGYPC